jgi:ABC-2 type transport system permease protein
VSAIQNLTASTRRRPLAALSKAEFLQFRRSRTLLLLGTVFPAGIPLFEFFIGRNRDVAQPMLAATTFEMFALMSLLFLQY